MIRFKSERPYAEKAVFINSFDDRACVCVCVCVCGYLAAKFVTDAGRLRDLARSRESC